MLHRAALAGLRGCGRVEPNPMVGCAIGTPSGKLLALGHHRVFGGPHAEIEALERCRQLGYDPRGATCWVTLEPCVHHGKTPPCTDALIDAGVARVVYAQPDPGKRSGGGADRLRAAGIDVEHCTDSRPASALALPFIKRVRTGLPWIVAKWAQTVDGKIATREGDSKWISNRASRRDVHRRRGMSSAILSAIGTIRADDPRLTVREVSARRRPLRIIIDPDAQTPPEAAILGTTDHSAVAIVTLDASTAAARRLRDAGATIVEAPRASDQEIDLTSTLRELAQSYDLTSVYCEAGPRLLGRLFARDLVDEAIVYVAPRFMGDPEAPSALASPGLESLSDPARWSVWRHRVRGDDVQLGYLRQRNLNSGPVA